MLVEGGLGLRGRVCPKGAYIGTAHLPFLLRQRLACQSSKCVGGGSCLAPPH